MQVRFFLLLYSECREHWNFEDHEGIDIDKDIMEKMEFKPEVSREIKKMPEIVFGAQEMERRDIETWATEI